MSCTKVTSKGQITIPANIRKEFQIKAGDHITFFKSLSGDLKVHVSRMRKGSGRGTIKAPPGLDLSREAIGQVIADGIAEKMGIKTKQAKKA